MRPTAPIPTAPMLVAVLLAATGCGGAGHVAATTSATPPPCLELISTLQQIPVPRTAVERRRAIERLAAVGRALETHYGIGSTQLAVEAYAAALRVRQEAMHAIADGRPTAARRLFANAHLIAVRATGLAAELADRCPPR